MTLAVEIGLWSDKAAAFVEDVVVVTEEGAEPLTRSPEVPIAIA
jgi:hypothetical protein